MSQRSRTFLAAVALGAILTLAMPAPSQAAGLRGGSAPVLDAWERVWEWLTRLARPGDSPVRPAARGEKEGSMINPDGSPRPGTTAPAPDPATTDEGPRIDPDGVP